MPEYDGTEVLITGPLEMRNSRVLFSGEVTARLRYAIRAHDGKNFCVQPHSLKKKRPPREDWRLVRWSECPWQPQTVNS